jgi:uncharacterized protein (DUF1778 family)
LIVAVVVLVGGFFAYKYFAPIKQIESIAVMPFVNESGSADVEYLSDGMTETLTRSLSQLAGLQVTDFAVHSLINTADEVLERQHMRTLSNRDRDVFLALLDADDEPNEALKRAFKAHRDLIAK